MRKTFIFIVSFLTLFSSCIMDEVISEKEKDIESFETKIEKRSSKTDSIFKKHSFVLKNTIDEIDLYVANISLDNFYNDKMLIFKDTVLLKTNDSLVINNVSLPILTNVMPWNTLDIPSENNGSYIKLHATFNYNFIKRDNNKLDLNTIAIPFKYEDINTFYVVFEDKCKWFVIDGNTPYTLLQPITFEVTVDNWK